MPQHAAMGQFQYIGADIHGRHKEYILPDVHSTDEPDSRRDRQEVRRTKRGEAGVSVVRRCERHVEQKASTGIPKFTTTDIVEQRSDEPQQRSFRRSDPTSLARFTRESRTPIAGDLQLHAEFRGARIRQQHDGERRAKHLRSVEETTTFELMAEQVHDHQAGHVRQTRDLEFVGFERERIGHIAQRYFRETGESRGVESVLEQFLVVAGGPAAA